VVFGIGCVPPLAAALDQTARGAAMRRAIYASVSTSERGAAAGRNRCASLLCWSDGAPEVRLGSPISDLGQTLGCRIGPMPARDRMPKLRGHPMTHGRRMKTSELDALPSLARRRFLEGAGLAVVAAGPLAGGTASAQTERAPRSSAADPSRATSFVALKQIDAGVLNVGYAEAGPADGPPVLLLHGWPYDIHAYVDVAPLLAARGYRVIVPYLRGYGTTRFVSASTPRNGQPAALAVDVTALMDALRIEKALIGGFDWGGRSACIVAALWPERCKALVAVSGYLIGSQEANRAPLPPAAELQWWYQFYFATERGRAGYERYRREFAKLIWQTASPKWQFDDATFARSAPAFDNPDHVAISIHNYRWRLALADGEAQYDALETKLAQAPVIRVPTITLEGDANGAPHPEPSAYAAKFVGLYQHRLVEGGVGHNLPQEAPRAFAQAIADVDRF
jgi:pimeloyl-ACP methyl ester carboxylesterase